MDLINYIALFRNLLRRSENLVKNSLQREAKEIALPIINCIVDDIIELLTMCKRKQFILSQNEQWDFQHKFSSHQKYLDELVEELGLVKECTKCNTHLPATSAYFYPDKNTRTGLRSECRACYSKAKKLYYQKKIKIRINQI